MSYLELGHVSKAHGLGGDVILHLITDRTERITPGAVLYLGKRAEMVAPFTVASSQPYQSKWLVRFEGVEGRDEADLLRGRTIFGEPLTDEELLDDDAIFVHQVIGKRVIDQHGTDHGPVLSVIDNPASDLLELADDKLVPLTFFVSQDDTTIRVDVPVGLLDDEAEEAR